MLLERQGQTELDLSGRAEGIDSGSDADPICVVPARVSTVDLAGCPG